MCTRTCGEDPSVCPQGTTCQTYTGFGSICVYPQESETLSEIDEDPDLDMDPSDDLPQCGNGVVEDDETCDDGNTITEACEYGEVERMVCNDQCQSSQQIVSYCGDGVINGNEECDGGSWCSTECEGNTPPCGLSSTGCPEIEWISIEGGSFEMMKTEITVGMYRMCVEGDGCTYQPSTLSQQFPCN